MHSNKHGLDTSGRIDSLADFSAVMTTVQSITASVQESHAHLMSIRQHKQVIIDGEHLDIASVVAVARQYAAPSLDSSAHCHQRIKDSVTLLEQMLQNGETIYGVNTGFGGSADTRSQNWSAVQTSLLQMQQYGTLTPADRGIVSADKDGYDASNAMPSEWVRAAMLVRVNSVARGHSAVTLHAIQTIIKLLANDLIPLVPLKGSISASGDLSPLSYMAGVITGNPDLFVRTPEGTVIPSDQALKRIATDPIQLGPKEGLGLINGTAPSTAVASLAMYQINKLTVFAQVLTAMAVEALLGTAGNFDPFLARVRPHRGQTEVARNINGFLRGSRLTRTIHPRGVKRLATALYQDRYALRTASQWLGPQLEDLALAQEQIVIELNSTTDNPLIDYAEGKIHHGGNFQATSITSAMEKSRIALQMIGKLMFAQTSELINVNLSNGLPPNLAADEPSTSYTMKGMDIGMAAYTSELGYLSNPVSSHVQAAEMHNQAVNSLALISARQTHDAARIVSKMSASFLYVVCQALDLRVMQITFFNTLEAKIAGLCDDIFSACLDADKCQALQELIWPHIEQTWLSLSSKDSGDRAYATIQASIGDIGRFILDQIPRNSRADAFEAMGTWAKEAEAMVHATFLSARAEFFVHQPTMDYLGEASKIMYKHVRQDLRVPFHRGLEDDPTLTTESCDRRKATLGTWIGIIEEDFRQGGLHVPLMRCFSNHDRV